MVEAISEEMDAGFRNTEVVCFKTDTFSASIPEHIPRTFRWRSCAVPMVSKAKWIIIELCDLYRRKEEHQQASVAYENTKFVRFTRTESTV